MPNMVSTVLIDFRLLTVPSEADIMEKIVRYQYKRTNAQNMQQARRIKNSKPTGQLSH